MKAYPADPLDRYLRALRASFQGKVSSTMAATQSSGGPEIATYKSIDAVLSSIEDHLLSTMVELVVPPAEEASEDESDDVPSPEEPGGPA